MPGGRRCPRTAVLADGHAGRRALDGAGVGPHHVQALPALGLEEGPQVSRDVQRVSRRNDRS